MSSLVEAKISRFFSQFPELSFKKGRIILEPNDALDYIYNLKLGYVKSYSVNEDGFDLVINIFKPNSFFPITETLAGKSNPYYFEAVTDAVLQKAPVDDVYGFLKENGDVLFDLTRRISSGLEGFMTRTQYLIRSNASQKVASTIVVLARRFGMEMPGNQIKILIPQTQTDIANFSGCSRETTSIELKKLEDLKLISTAKKIITIHDFEKLKEFSTIYHEDEPLPYNF